MKPKRSIGLWAIVLLLLPFAAQALPPGSYQESCQNIDIKRLGKVYVLTAQCMTDGRGWQAVEMDLDEANRCKELVNTNGRLICLKDVPGLPGGSYRNSCEEITIRNDLLRARCLNERGRWKETSYPLKDYPCPNGLANKSGTLVCE